MHRSAAPTTAAAALGARVALLPGISAVAAGQLGRARVARIPLFLVATMQSLGLVVLLRGVVHRHDGSTAAAVVAGSTILVVGFVALNLLAQRLGSLRASYALDYYAALPVSPAAVVLGTTASYAIFALPGALVTAVVGDVIYRLPVVQLWVVVPAVLSASLALAGAGALLGLLLPRPELATVAGQLGMTAVLFLGIIPVAHLPELVRGVRVCVPGLLSVDAFVDALRHAPSWSDIAIRLVASGGYGCLLLSAAGAAMRRAVQR